MVSIRKKLLQVWRSSAESGMPLPSEAILASSLGASRPKVREELIRLESEGLVTRVPNSGTFPNRSALHMGLRLDQSYEFSRMLEAAGYEASVEVLASEWCQLDPQKAERLGVRVGSSAFQTTKRWSANGTPVMIAVDVIPAEPGHVSPAPSATVFELVEELRGSPVAWETSWIQGENADDDQSRLLDIPRGENVLAMSTLGISVLGTPLYLASETLRQGVVPYGMIRNVPVVDAD